MKKAKIQPRGVPDWAIYLFLFAATMVVYGQVHNYAFLQLDDVDALVGNPHVRDGFSWGGVAWAFTTSFEANWFPLTWLSHMLDCQLFGLDAGWHHLTNVAIHTASSMLLFAFMKRMTGRLWESAFVAFVFALHPLHVESVAWVSERKDVLFAFFWFLSTWFYLDFIGKRTVGRYLLIVLVFCLGLLSKQMIVTLPFVLLLLDVWPLRRISAAAVWEKVPLMALSIAASLTAFLVQRKGGAVQSVDFIPVTARVANALVSYVAYLADFFWPAKLVAFYIYPTHLPAWEVILAALVLAGISILAVVEFRRRPYLAVGWFWYLGTLAPVIGLIQVGYQSRADRYTYVPLIGISIMVAWGAADAFEKWPGAQRKFAAAAIVVCSAWLVMTWIQIQYWRDGVTLHRHSIAVNFENYRAHEDLGVELGKRGDYAEAARELYRSVEQNPGQVHALNSLGAVLFLMGRKDEAIEQYRRAIAMDPNGAMLHLNLGNALADEGKIDEAMQELSTAVRLDPAKAEPYFDLARLLVMQNRRSEAMAYLTEALRIDPDLPQARQELDALRRLP
jgi:tetratricopeptide (TPR) repeat protein